MKNTFFNFLTVILLTGTLSAQVPGKVIITNASDKYPEFVASLGGVRMSNTYSSKVVFPFVDGNTFRLKIFQYGVINPLNFAVNSEANYISRYVITKDSAGGYFKVVLESKTLGASTDNEGVNPAPSTTVAVLTASTEPISAKDYSDMLAAIKKESFETSKLDLAKNFFSNQYHSSEQVLGVLKLFSFENNKVTFAKSAYAKTSDKKNYYKVYDGFSSKNSKQELSDFIEKNP